MELQEVIITLLVIVAIGGVQLYRHLKREKKELPIREKIKEHQQAGHVLMHEQDVPLTHAERNRIRSRQIWMSIGMVMIMLAIFIGGACILIFAIDVEMYMVLTGLLLLSGGWMYWVIKTNAKQKAYIETGNKTIVRGIITKKYLAGDDTTTYYIVVDKAEISVKKADYKAYRLGDAVEFHIFKPYYHMVLYHKKLPGAGLSDMK